MTSRYIYIEPCFKRDNYISNGLSVIRNDKSSLRLLRLFSGSCRVKDDFDGKVYSFKKNYMIFPFSESSRYSQAQIVNLFPDEIRAQDLAGYFYRLSENEEFYSLVESELLNCLVAREKERYLESFLFLYRILEGVSYTVPLIYVSKQKSYERSFNALKKYMSKNSKDGELDFFKKFVSETFKNEYFFQSTVDVDVSNISYEELRSDYYSIYKSKVKDEFLVSYTEDEELNFSFLGFLIFLIEIRNRYFHFLQGTWRENIGTSKIIYPDEFFKPLVDHGINWVGIIMFEIIRFDIEHQLR